MEYKRLSSFIRPDQDAWLKEIVATKGESISSWVRKAIDELIKQQKREAQK
jgi:hypothetical protein